MKKTNSNQISIFLLKLLLTGLVVLNMWIVNLDKDQLTDFRDTLGMGSKQFSGAMGGTVMFLTTFMVGTIVVVKRSDETFDPLIPGMASIFFNYVALVNLVTIFDGKGSILVPVVIATAIVSIVIKLLVEEEVTDKYYFFIATQATMLVLFLLYVVCMLAAVSVVRGVWHVDNSQFFLNPVIVPLLLMAHFAISFIDSSRRAMQDNRMVNMMVYGLFFVVLLIFVPPTIHGAWSADVPYANLYKYVIVGSYCMCFFIVLEVARPDAYFAGRRTLLSLIARHVVALTIATGFIGALLGITANNVAEKAPALAIFVAHACVGPVIGILLPLSYFVYEKYVRPKLYLNALQGDRARAKRIVEADY